MGDESPGPHSGNPVHQRVDVALQIIQPGDLRLHKVLGDPPCTAQELAVDLPQQLRVLIEQRFAEIRHLRHCLLYTSDAADE